MSRPDAVPTPAQRPPRERAFARSVPLLTALLFVSGAVALVYQSLWMRQLSLILGSTTHAVGTVLAAFMAGLGVGAYAFGRSADRARDPIALYAMLELLIGIVGLASPFVLAQGNGLYAACYVRFHDTALLGLARFALGFGFVAVPAFLMGGTLPVVARCVVRAPDAIGRSVGLLYAVNTIGAAVGVAVLPLALLPGLGMRATLVACGVTNIAIAGVAWAARTTPTPPSAERQPAAGSTPEGSRRVLGAFFVSGFVALALEVLWNRFFTMYVGTSIYSFAVILFLYLAGIFAGGLLFVRMGRNGHAARRVFAVCLFLLLVDLAVTIPLMDRIVYLQVAILGTLGISFASFQFATVAATMFVILPATVLLGVSFPAVAQAASGKTDTVGGDVGVAYLVNTAGTTAGALATSFVLIPNLGVERSLHLLAFLTAGAFVLVADGRRATAVLAAAAVSLVPLVAPRWDARRMHTGLSRNPLVMVELWRHGVLDQAIDKLEVRDVREGVDATVSVAGSGDQLSLFVDGKPDASNGVDMATQVVVGHLPLLLHPAPRDVLLVGMGSGVTLGAVTRHPVATIDLVEIAPEVLELGDRYFSAENRGALDDPRVTAYVEDGRNFVGFNEARTYDIVISEPSNPWMTGVANLFTDEFFAQVRRRLRPGGVLGQWFHFYSMGLDEIRTLVGTLHRHFPYLYVFALDRQAAGDLILFAAETPLDFSRLLTTLGAQGPVADDLRRFGFDAPDDLMRSFVLSPENADRFVGDAPLNSDDRPEIELRAPKALFRDTVNENLQALLAASDGARMEDSGATERQAGFPAADGLRRVFSGYRMQAEEPTPDAVTPRTLLAESRFADETGQTVVVLSAPGVRTQSGLTRLATSVALMSNAASHVVQGATVLTFIVSTYIVIFRYPSPIAISERLRRN